MRVTVVLFKYGLPLNAKHIIIPLERIGEANLNVRLATVNGWRGEVYSF